jgi:hypothetical protein
VQEAKPLIKEQLISEGRAIPYAEPEGVVISRSGDECVVALTDQWHARIPIFPSRYLVLIIALRLTGLRYLTYGEPQWKEQAFKALEKLNTYNEESAPPSASLPLSSSYPLSITAMTPLCGEAILDALPQRGTRSCTRWGG